MTNLFDEEYALIRELGHQRSEIEQMPYYEYRYIVKKLIDELEARRKQQEQQKKDNANQSSWFANMKNKFKLPKR